MKIFSTKNAMQRELYLFFIIIGLLSFSPLFGQKILIDNTLSEQQLIENHLVEGCVEVSNITSSVNGLINGFSSFGYFERDLSVFPFENGIVLSTGNATSGGNTFNDNILNDGELSWGTDSDLENALGIINTHNATSIEFDFVSISNLIQFNYILASEEYFGNFPCDYSDGFAFLIRQSGTTDPYTNIALIPGTATPVNTNTIHDEIVGFCPAENDQFFDGYNIGDTNYNGRTTVLTATANIQPNVQYHIKLVIADQNDENYDSAVFIQGNSFNPTVDLGPDITTCATQYSIDGDIQNPLANYVWYRNSIVLPGENNPTLNVTESGTYTVEITIPLNGNDCVISDDIIITLNSEQTAETISDYEICDDISNDGIETFDLSTKEVEILAIMPPANYSISYHLTNVDAQTNSSPITAPIQNSSNPQTIYVRIEDSDSGCLAYTDFNLIVNALPNIIAPSNFQTCDDAVADGSTTIDLTQFDNEITQGESNLLVSYHYTQADADAGINAIPSPYVNSNPSETLFIRVVNPNTGCVSTTSFLIEVLELPDLQNIDFPPINGCEPDDDGFTFFDLTEVIPDILAQVTDVTITFHETQEDAENGTNAIADESNYENTIQNVQTLYIRIESNSNGCATIIPLTIHANLLVTGTDVHDFSRCDDESQDGIHDFNLNYIASQIVNDLENVTVTFYETEDDLLNEINPIDDLIPYTVTSSPHTLYVLIESPDCQRAEEIQLIIDPPVVLAPIAPFDYCDTDTDGITSIDLFSFNTTIIGDLTNVNVSYFESEIEAEENENALAQFYTNVSNPQILYVRVANNNTTCYDVIPIEINIISAPNITQPNDIVICDDDQDGFSIVNLDNIITEIVASTIDLTITFHNSNDDANLDVNEILSAQDYNASSETIYIRIESDITGCYALAELSIIVNTKPAFTTITPYQNCETDGNQTADFLFINKDDEILNSQTGKQVFYFESEVDANNRANIIDKNLNYTNVSSPQTIYVRVENLTDQDCYGVSSFEIEVGSIPLFTPPTNYIVCDDISNDGIHTFDLNEKIIEISQGSPENLTITFHTAFDDAENQVNEIDLSYTNTENPEQIYVRVENGTYCYAIAEFGLNVVQVPTVNLPSAIETCDDDYDGISTFDLTVAEFEILDIRNDDIVITYFENQVDLQADTNTIPNPENYSNISNPQTVYVKVLNLVSNCFVEIPLDLIVNLPPEINSIPEIEICENQTDTYDLNDASDILVDNHNDVNITYYANLNDAENQQNSLGTTYSYGTSSDTIYIRAEFDTTGCYRIQSFNLVVNPNPIANTPSDLIACDDDYDFQLVFDLETQTPSILGTQSGLEYTVSYYETLVEAEDDINAIQDLNYNTFDGQEIFARVENNTTGCYDTAFFTIYVNRKPLVEIDDQVICLDNSPLTVIAGNLIAGDAYSWSTGETSSEIEIDQIGAFWVTVTSPQGCETTTGFEVIESEQATIEITETVDFSDPNNITITISGIGNYLYQLDDGEPQESPIFENVTLGYHTITVIDLNGCASITTEVLVIDAPKFFTPNNDGYFDTWHIIGVETLPGTTIHIFDRYGKQITYLTSTSEGWNGYYNGEKMPTNDYWFVANVVQGSREFQVKGHFTLRR